jgi:DNA-binding protein H-NS
MTFPTCGVSLDHLVESREAIEREIRQRVSDELAELDARRAVLITLLGGEPSEVFESVTIAPVASLPKYRDPETGKVWSGRGKRPNWFDADRANSFLIDPPSGDT